jgi:hypothetical protein
MRDMMSWERGAQPDPVVARHRTRERAAAAARLAVTMVDAEEALQCREWLA